MKPTLYAHPFSSYSQKALIALYENDTAFEYRKLGTPETDAELAALWPIRRFPILVDSGRTVVEATIIIEHLQRFHPGAVALIPAAPHAALDVRTMDRFFDNYVMTPTQKLVGNALRPEADRDAYGVAEARTMLDGAYAWLDGVMAKREWAAGDDFSLADCAAAPSLFYADWAHPIAASFANLIAYRRRLLARPSFARCVDEARYFRPYFPLGAPDRD
ncbi:glutathione S-transferase family protein [Solimonas terrae]|uniref:Glutathione S-transferase family protein n=1 Tax=Solimonas terrae TaxID=1396819 RepID=A0A6M2BRL8_9GAMM|nr:glutathione S-transferase family protein [Solimonas terrae]NGY04861.1 glutathione S-transferase family protein [Solimonas terrae]